MIVDSKTKDGYEWRKEDIEKFGFDYKPKAS